MNYKKQDRNKDCVQSIGLTMKLKMVGWLVPDGELVSLPIRLEGP